MWGGLNALEEALDQNDIKTLTGIVDKSVDSLEAGLAKDLSALYKKIESENDFLADEVNKSKDYIFDQMKSIDEQNFKRSENVIKTIERENDTTYDSLAVLAKNDSVIYNALKK